MQDVVDMREDPGMCQGLLTCQLLERLWKHAKQSGAMRISCYFEPTGARRRARPTEYEVILQCSSQLESE